MAETRIVCFLSKTVNICGFKPMFLFKSTMIWIWSDILAYLHNSWFSSQIWRTGALNIAINIFRHLTQLSWLLALNVVRSIVKTYTAIDVIPKQFHRTSLNIGVGAFKLVKCAYKHYWLLCCNFSGI